MDLRLVDLRKRFGRHAALDGVSLHVHAGDCYGFLGHNGAGKTTALRIALGLIRSDSGRVVVDGFDAASDPREARARQGGLIETPYFYTWLSGPRNLALVGELSGMAPDASRKEADRLIKAVGLEHAGDRGVGGYSQGMRQRLGIALALFGDPPLVLLDEPMNGLDPEGMDLIRRLLIRLTREEGRTVVLSSHQLHEVAGLCNRIGILKQGRMLVEAETEALLSEGGRRYLLKTDDDAKAREILLERGITPNSLGNAGLTFECGEFAPEVLSRELMERGLSLFEYAHRPESLEEIYLRYSRGESKAASGAGETGDADTHPVVRRAPRLPVLRAFRFEGRRLGSHVAPAAVLLLPAILAGITVWRLWASTQAHLAEVARGELFSFSSVTAFESVALALRDALPLAALLVAGLASQSLAGELSRGTLRNLLLRPVGRWQLAVGKALGLMAATTFCYLLLAGVALGASALAFNFGDVVEIMEIRSAEPWVMVKAGDLMPVLVKMIPTLLVPLLGYAGLGFLVGSLTRRSTTGLGLAAGAVVFLDLFRALGRSMGFEKALLSAYLPSPLGDTSYVAHLLDLIQAPNDVPRGYLDGTILVPLIWLVVCTALSALALSRRSVP